MTALLGVDAGTTGIKTVDYDCGGRPLARASEPTPGRSPTPGSSEQDMKKTYERVAARPSNGLSDELEVDIGAVGVTGQGSGCWLVDEEGHPVRDAILWNDGRASSIIDEWRANGTYRSYFDRFGDGPFPGMAVPVLSWLGDNEPDTIAAAETVLACKDWIRFRLTGETATDHSDASLMHFAPKEERFDDSIAERTETPTLSAMEPRVQPPTAVAGTITDITAVETGLPEGTPIVTGCMDFVATALASGASSSGAGSSIVGTTLQTQVLTRRPTVEGPPVGYTLVLGINDPGLRAMGAMVGTENIEWAREEIATGLAPQEHRKEGQSGTAWF